MQKPNRESEAAFAENKAGTNVECRILNVECRIIKNTREKQVTKASKEFDIEKRLIDFAVRIVRMTEILPKTRAGNHIAGQILRSGTSPAPNYGEAQSAESRSDFIHKMNICLKELRETRVWLLIIVDAKLINQKMVESLIDENDQLISVFATSVKTAKKNQKSS